MRHFHLSTVLFSALWMTTAQAAPWQLDASHTRVGFSVNHLGFSTVHGQFESVDAQIDYDDKKPNALKVEASIKTDSLDSGWAARDEHLAKAEFFNVEKFPTMTFRSTSVKMQGAKKGLLMGDLTLLGVTKPVTLNFTINKRGVNPINKNDTLGFAASTRIKRSDFGMNAYVPAVGDMIDVRIDAEMSPVAAP